MLCLKFKNLVYFHVTSYNRYKIEIDVSYESEKATFVLWDREVNQLMGVSAAQLRHNMIQVNEFVFSNEVYLIMVFFYDHLFGYVRLYY